MALIEFADKGNNYSILVHNKTQLLNLLRESVAITHYRKV